MISQVRQSKTIRTELINEMRYGAYADCEHLPRENVLSEKLGISRTQLRDILASLDREGFITRRHGVGTIINRHVLDAANRMDIEIEFMDMIRSSGHTPAIAFVEAEEGTADAATAKQLKIAEGAPVLQVSRLCTADGKPAIYCEDVFDKSLVRKKYTDDDLKQPIFDFLQNFCNIYAYLDLTDLRPVVADERLAKIFDLPVGAPLLYMEEVDYDVYGTPVFRSAEYFADGIFRHTVLRKKL